MTRNRLNWSSWLRPAGPRPRRLPRISGARSRRSSGGIRTAPSGGPFRRISDPGGGRRRSFRWSRAGAWERLLSLVQERGVQLGMVFLDGTNVRAHQKAAGLPKGGSGAERDHREALGCSRGGFRTKAYVIADGQGRAIAFRLAPGQAYELPMRFHCSVTCPACPIGSSGTGATPATLFVSTSGT